MLPLQQWRGKPLSLLHVLGSAAMAAPSRASPEPYADSACCMAAKLNDQWLGVDHGIRQPSRGDWLTMTACDSAVDLSSSCC